MDFENKDIGNMFKVSLLMGTHDSRDCWLWNKVDTRGNNVVDVGVNECTVCG